MHIRQMHGGGQLQLCTTPSPPFSRATSLSLVVCLYLACSKLSKLTAASNVDGVWKNHDYQRISGPPLPEVKCHQHLDNHYRLLHIYVRLRQPSTHFTQMPLCHWSVEIVYHRCCCKNTQKCNIFLLITDPLGGYHLWLAILESSHWADVNLLACNASTYCFQDIHCQMAKTGVCPYRPTFRNP